MPLVHIKVGITAVDVQFAAFAARHRHIQTLDILHAKVQRSHLSRNGHTSIVGYDVRLFIAQLRILGQRIA